MPTNETNFFTLLNLEESYDLNRDDLNSQYLRKQIENHPDKFINATNDEKEVSQKLSSSINAAYETLKDPIKRAIYILQLKGIDINNANNIDSAALPQTLLIKTLEYHEKIEDCESKEEIESLYNELMKAYQMNLDELKALFANNSFNKIADVLVELSFYKKLLDQVIEKLDNSFKL